MVNITVNVCRLCLKAAEDSVVINGSERDIIEIVIPQVNLDVGDSHRICRNCVKLFKQSFDFKSKCLEIEDGIHDFKKEGQIPVDLEKSLGIKEVTKSRRICRTCSEYLKNNSYVELNSGNGLHSIFNKCLPEMDIELTVEPVICLNCHGILNKLFNLITSCEKNEKKIRFYFESSNNNWKVAWCNIVQHEQNQDLDCNQIVRENDYFSKINCNVEESASNKEIDLMSKQVINEDLENLNVKKNFCEINKNYAQMPGMQNIYQISNVTGIERRDSTDIPERPELPEVFPSVSNEIYIVSDSDENYHNNKATKTSKKRLIRDNKIKPNNSTRVTDGDITSRVEHSWVAIEKESSENIVLNDISYFSTNTYIEESISNNESYSMSKKVRNANLENLMSTSEISENHSQMLCIENIFSTKNLTGFNFTSTTERLDGDVNNEIYIVSDSDESAHNIKTTISKRKTRGNKIKQSNLTRITDDEVSSSDHSDCSWVDSGNSTDSSGEWFSPPPPKKHKTKKPKSVSTKPIQLKNSVFCKYCFFSTSSTWVITRHITTCPRSPFAKNLTKTSLEENSTSLQKSNADILLRRIEQKNIAVTENIEELSEATTTESQATNLLERKENVEPVQNEVSNYIRKTRKIKKDLRIQITKSSTLNSKGNKQNGHQSKRNNLKDIFTDSKNRFKYCLTVAKDGTCIELKPSRVNSKRTRRSEDRMKRESLKLAIKINKKEPKDGLNIATERTSTELEPSTYNFKGITEEQDQVNKTFSMMRDTANGVENCTEECTRRNSCEPNKTKECLTVITENISEEDPSELNSKTIQGEGDLIKRKQLMLISKAVNVDSIAITERTSTELEPSNFNFKGNMEEYDEINKDFSILTNNATNIENRTSNCTGINASELIINTDCIAMATQVTPTEESKCKKNNNKQLKDGITVTTERNSTELEPFSFNFKGTSEEQDETSRSFSILEDAADIIEKKTLNESGETIGRNSCELFINKDSLTVTLEETSMKEPIEKSTNVAVAENIRKPSKESD